MPVYTYGFRMFRIAYNKNLLTALVRSRNNSVNIRNKGACCIYEINASCFKLFINLFRHSVGANDNVIPALRFIKRLYRRNTGLAQPVHNIPIVYQFAKGKNLCRTAGFGNLGRSLLRQFHRTAHSKAKPCTFCKNDFQFR